ncbi:hypothetical protein [Vibrio rumoiensis]|uniref:hypothetical protein n=1 Tax=Vibrio rumoiensis TaxID=76258 RepID=UPI003AA80D64
MNTNELISSFYEHTLQAIEVAEEISKTIDEIRLSGIRLDADLMAEKNQMVIELTTQLLAINRKRLTIAEMFGVNSTEFFETVVTRLPHRSKHAMYRAHKTLESQMQICETKMSDLQSLLKKQNDLMVNISENFSFRVKA